MAFHDDKMFSSQISQAKPALTRATVESPEAELPGCATSSRGSPRSRNALRDLETSGPTATPAPTRRVSIVEPAEPQAVDDTIEFDVTTGTLPRPTYALYRRMRQRDAHYDRGMSCMNWQKFGDGLANASAGCLATSLAIANPATGIGVFTVVTAVEIGIAIVANTSQAHALDVAEARRRHGVPAPLAHQQQGGRSLAASGAVDAVSALLLAAGFAVDEWADESGAEWRAWFVFAVLTAYKLVQSKNSMDEVGLWRCQTRSSPEPNTQNMLTHHPYFVNAVQMGFTSGIYATTTMSAFVLLESVRSETKPWFTWVAIGAAMAAGAISAVAKAWFGIPAAAAPASLRQRSVRAWV